MKDFESVEAFQAALDRACELYAKATAAPVGPARDRLFREIETTSPVVPARHASHRITTLVPFGTTRSRRPSIPAVVSPLMPAFTT